MTKIIFFIPDTVITSIELFAVPASNDRIPSCILSPGTFCGEAVQTFATECGGKVVSPKQPVVFFSNKSIATNSCFC